MPPKKKDKGKGILKDPVSQTPSKASQTSSKASQTSPPKELLSSAMPIKSWIDMIEDQEAQSKALASHEQVNEWMKSISKSPTKFFSTKFFVVQILMYSQAHKSIVV